MSRALEYRRLTYRQVGGTAPADDRWVPPPGWRAYERTVRIGSGDACWSDTAALVRRWAVKTRTGFRVVPGSGAGQDVAVGARYWLRAGVGSLSVREPVEVVAVVDRDDRSGFAYGTLDGHPVSGEEAFVAHRGVDGDVHLTLRSLTGPAPHGPWRPLFPALLVVQRGYRWRYARALTAP